MSLHNIHAPSNQAVISSSALISFFWGNQELRFPFIYILISLTPFYVVYALSSLIQEGLLQTIIKHPLELPHLLYEVLSLSFSVTLCRNNLDKNQFHHPTPSKISPFMVKDPS